MGDAYRYFWGGAGTKVYSDRDDEDIKHSIAAGLTEVRVVPLDAIVIRRDELPKVYADQSVVAGPVAAARDETPADAMRHALGFLAIAEYLREHPPVDEEQVHVLAEELHELDYREADSNVDLARRLVAAGWSKGGA